MRFRENVSLLYKSYSDIRLRYKYNKNVLVAVGFRDINEWNQELNQVHKDRYYSDLYLKYKADRFLFSVRNRYQKQGNLESYTYLFRMIYIIILEYNDIN